MNATDLREVLHQKTIGHKAELASGKWWHSIDLGDGIVTQGLHPPAELAVNYADRKSVG